MSTRRLWLLLISLVLIPTIALIISFSLVVQKVLFSYLLVSEFAHMFFPVCNALWFLYLRASCPCNFPWEISLKSYVSFKSGSVAPMDPCMYFQNNRTYEHWSVNTAFLLWYWWRQRKKKVKLLFWWSS